MLDAWQKERSHRPSFSTIVKTLDKLMANYSNEIKRMHNQAERLGYQATIYSSSVSTGVGVRDAMRTFFNAIRPQPK